MNDRWQCQRLQEQRPPCTFTYLAIHHVPNKKPPEAAGDNFYLVPRSLILSNAKDIARAKSRGGHSDFSENAVTVARQCRTCTDFPHYAACIRAGLHLSFEPVLLMWDECSTRRGVCQMKVQPCNRTSENIFVVTPLSHPRQRLPSLHPVKAFKTTFSKVSASLFTKRESFRAKP